MSPFELEPLEPQLWFAEIRGIRSRVLTLDGEAPDAIIRKSFYLIELAPAPLKLVIAATIDETRLERLLAAGSYDEAALALMNSSFRVVFTEHPNEPRCEARMELIGHQCEGTGVGQSRAKAAIAAWADCLLCLGARVIPDSSSEIDPHKSPPAGPRPWTEH